MANYNSSHTGAEIDEAVTWAKQGKDSGKVLSTNDYTTADKQKVANTYTKDESNARYATKSELNNKADLNGNSSQDFNAAHVKIGSGDTSSGPKVRLGKSKTQMGDDEGSDWLKVNIDVSGVQATYIPVPQAGSPQYIVATRGWVADAAGLSRVTSNSIASRSWVLTQIANSGGGGGTPIDLSDYVTYDALDSTLTSYATKSYVDSAIAGGGGGADLTGYATQEWCNMNFMKPDNTYTITQVDALLSAKQNTLVSGTNVKTINGESILVEGRDTDVTLNGGNIAYPNSGSVSSFRGKSIEQCLDSLNSGKANKQGNSSVVFNASTMFADKFSITNTHDSSYVGNVEIRQVSDGYDTIVELKDGSGDKIVLPFGQAQIDGSYNPSEVVAKQEDIEGLSARVNALEEGNNVKFKMYGSIAAMNADATNYDEGEAVIAYCGTSEFYILNTSTQMWHPFAPEP